MDKELYIWPPQLTEKMLELRYEHDDLFRRIKKPWREFHKILRKNKFPKSININRVRKKWSYLYDTYRIVKRENNTQWQYYNHFEKIFATSHALDKYEMWSDEWRLKLVTCITEAKLLKLDYFNTWTTVEHAMRCQDLPIDCCIQDIKGLWHHIKVIFRRKHKIASKRGAEAAAWPVYDAMLKYYQLFESDCLASLEREESTAVSSKASGKRTNKQNVDDSNEGGEFQWSKHITESFIQLRFQHDWLFTQNKRAWSKFLEIMIDEYGFPKALSSRELSRKWASTFAEYQKAKATKNTSWMYYNLFELYLGEGSLSLNPELGWGEEWILNLISIRTDLEHYFRDPAEKKRVITGWREVEKRLRTIGLPLDHSLLQLQEIWNHLLKTFRWKKKFAGKGVLMEQWPYFDAMTHYEEVKEKANVSKHKMEPVEHEGDVYEDDYEDDIKLFDLKQRLETQVKPKIECLDANQCRACSGEDGCVNIFEHNDAEGVNLANKLKIVGGVEIDTNDNLPSQICLKCVKELENAYKFRRKCQEVDQNYRSKVTSCFIKLEQHQDDNMNNTEDISRNDNYEEVRTDLETDHFNDDDFEPVVQKKKKVLVKKVSNKPRVARKKQKKDYIYTKVCEVCGKHTRNLMAHLDMHSSDKMYSCEICDKKFKFKSGLTIHKAVHDPTPRKTCEVCGKTFHILAQYRRHFVYHANERKFECETCGKRFNSPDILRVHVRIHTDERPFACPNCGKTFRTAGCVSRHRRIVHGHTKNVPPAPPPQ